MITLQVRCYYEPVDQQRVEQWRGGGVVFARVVDNNQLVLAAVWIQRLAHVVLKQHFLQIKTRQTPYLPGTLADSDRCGGDDGGDNRQTGIPSRSVNSIVQTFLVLESFIHLKMFWDSNDGHSFERERKSRPFVYPKVLKYWYWQLTARSHTFSPVPFLSTSD